MNQKSAISNQPAEINIESLQFTDLFDIDEIQKLQDSFADAFGIASIITRPDGTPITRPSRFSKLCSEIIHNTECGRQNCQMLNPADSIKDLQKLTVRCALCGKWEICAGIT
ncbi:MAG: multi-sensor signal transduction histidine kinase, partial [uncultured bacterium]